MRNKKVAVLTGASSGIGKALAFELPKEYSTVFLLGRNSAELEVIKNSLKNDTYDIIIISLDLESDESIKSATKAILEKTEHIDLLINNAGLSQRSLASETDVSIEKRIFQINYFGPVSFTKGVLPAIRKAEEGKIVITSSIAGKFGYALRSSYSAAKHALHGYFESLRFEEEKNNVLVLFSIPGRVKTSVSKNALLGNGEAYQQMDKGQEDGISAESCANQIMRQIKRNQREKLIGGKEILMVSFKKWFPWLFFHLAKRELSKDGAI